jgi:hypothetical protein
MTSWYKLSPELSFRSYLKCVKPVYRALHEPLPKQEPDPFTKCVLGDHINHSTVQRHKKVTMAIGEFHENVSGSIKGYRKLPIGNPSECDVVKTDLTEIFELKNRSNTMNSSSASSVIKKLERCHDDGIKAHLILINCEGTVPRFKAPKHIEVWNGQQFYTHITGSDTFFYRLQNTLKYTMDNFKTFEEIEGLQSP